MTMLWQQDPFHKEWDFMCAVYSAIRDFLADENVSLQNWINFAIKHLGIVVRENYLAAMGWELVKLEDDTHKLERTETRVVQNYLQPMNALGLFMNCLNHGLPVTDPLPIIAKLSGLTNDLICVNTQFGEQAKSTNTMDQFRQFAKSNPQLAMSALFQVPAAHPLITQGVSVHQLPGMGELPTEAPLFMVQNEDTELDAMLDRIFRESEVNPGNPANLGNQYFAMDMGNGTPGKPPTRWSTNLLLLSILSRLLILTRLQVSIDTPDSCSNQRSHLDSSRANCFSTQPTTPRKRIFAASKSMAGSADKLLWQPGGSDKGILGNAAGVPFVRLPLPCERSAVSARVACGRMHTTSHFFAFSPSN